MEDGIYCLRLQNIEEYKQYMILFPKRNCVSASGTRQRFHVSKEHTQTMNGDSCRFVSSKNHDKENLMSHNNLHQQDLTQSSANLHQQQLRYLIQQNSSYYMSKVKITDKLRPNQYRFKIPTRTPQTIYKKNYIPKSRNPSVDNLKLNTNNLSQTIKIKEVNEKLLKGTTYQNAFCWGKSKSSSKRDNCGKMRKGYEEKLQKYDDVPRFFNTQNSCFLLNWGGKNTVTSMKPSYQSVATNLPLNSKTTYNNDFQGKFITPTKTIIPQSSISKFTNPFIINKSCYSQEFSQKENRHEMEKSYKPRHELIKTCSTFKGDTEYRTQFMKNPKSSEEFSFQMDKNDLEMLIMDL